MVNQQQQNTIQRHIESASANALQITAATIGPLDLTDLPMILPLEGTTKQQQMEALSRFSDHQLRSMFMMEKERREAAEQKLSQARHWLLQIVGKITGSPMSMAKGKGQQQSQIPFGGKGSSPCAPQCAGGKGSCAPQGVKGGKQCMSPQQMPPAMDDGPAMKRRRVEEAPKTSSLPYNPAAMPQVPAAGAPVVPTPMGPTVPPMSMAPMAMPPHGVVATSPQQVQQKPALSGSFSSYVPDAYKKWFLCPYNECKRKQTGTCMWSHDVRANKFDTSYPLVANLEFAQQAGFQIPLNVFQAAVVEDPQNALRAPMFPAAGHAMPAPMWGPGAAAAAAAPWNPEMTAGPAGKADPLGGKSFSSFVPNECRKFFRCPYNQCKRDASECMWSHDQKTQKFDTLKSVVENLDIAAANGIEIPDDVRVRAEEQAKSKDQNAEMTGSFSSYVPQPFREYFACPYSSCKWGESCQWSHATAAKKFDVSHSLRENLEMALGGGMDVSEEVLVRAEKADPKRQN